jgi:acyl-CoA dehydrogenase
MLGPLLLDMGSEEQKMEHLPDIARGRIRWCQGYSEPQAGSDLANIRTRAELRGDRYIVNGHKIWTTYAQYSDWIFCLVRTDPEASKHGGIGFLLIELGTPGIRISPIKLISGHTSFCEVFFEDVDVPARNIVGPPNGGWGVAKRLLEHERKGQADLSDRQRDRVGLAIREITRERLNDGSGRVSDPVLRDQIAAYEIDDMAYQFTRQRITEEANARGSPGAVSAMMKYYAAELNKRRLELAVAAAGSSAFGWEDESFSPLELRLARDWLRSKANSIEGGSAEINLNIIAKRVLGLPD